MKPGLLCIDQTQFGYLTDAYQFCRHLTAHYAITYLCWDYGLERMTVPGVRVQYVGREGGKAARVLRFLRAAVLEARQPAYAAVFVEQCELCALLPLLAGRKRMILDIRSGSVHRHRAVRFIGNWDIRLESLAFPHVAVISESLRKMLGISARRGHILPLGADKPELPAKTFDAFRLFYVGSLESRHIDRTVQGVAEFLRDVRPEIPVHYDIVGFGRGPEEEQLNATIAACGMQDVVTFHGRVPHARLEPFLAKANIGVAFIPMVPQYDVQPATKLFEYLQAGMPVLATNTLENRLVVIKENGVLVNDTVEGVRTGLRLLYERRKEYSSAAIARTAEAYTWEAIVGQNLLPYLAQVTDPGHTNTHDKISVITTGSRT